MSDIASQKRITEDMILYTAGPIDLGTDVPNWRAALIEKFTKEGVNAVAFDPSTSYKLSAFGTVADRRDAYIEAVNAEALHLADVMVVVLPNGVTSIGTPIEIDTAHKNGTQIRLITDIPRGKSVYLNNRVSDLNWYYVSNLRDKAQFDDALSAVAANIMGMKTIRSLVNNAT